MADEMIRLEQLLDLLDQKIEDAKESRMNRNVVMVNRNEIQDLLDELRSELPAEIKRAQELLEKRDTFVDKIKQDATRKMEKADKDATDKLERAEREAARKVSESEVLRIAQEKAARIVGTAEDRSRQLYRVANEYAEDALLRTEEAIRQALSEVSQSRAQFHATSTAKMQDQRTALSEESDFDTDDSAFD